MDRGDLIGAVQRVAAFLQAAPLTSAIASLEGSLEGEDAAGVSSVTKAAAIDESLFDAAIKIRRDLGRVSDLIHAAAIALVLPRILRPGERVMNRPSLAAGNDPSRPFDLETNRRVAEFKLSRWLGRDAMRKRQTFKDFVHLAADTSGRMPELFVVGEAPARFLRLTRSKVGWGLDRSPATRELFAARFGSLAMPISEFTAGPGARVQITDLTPLLPSVGDLPADIE